MKTSPESPIKVESSEQLAKYKFSQNTLKKIEHNHLGDVKKANDSFSWDMYKQPAGYVAPTEKSTNLFSRLNDTVKVREKSV